ncbi:MAG TPA: cytochrome c oxidase subunit 3 family protein [Vicinamibacterales bacterium]|nr:cytochrome c oxidase subunit 3 family protein [Vicinamibacterales bacterium]
MSEPKISAYSAAHHPALAHHFDDLEQQQEASTLGMWVFLVTEVMFFGGLFMAYIVYRTWHSDAFAAGSSHLDVFLGGVNTVVLICSSLTMALAVHAAQTSWRRGQIVFLLLTMALGATFLVIKAFEYADKFEHHLVPGPHFEWPDETLRAPVQMFYSLYFAMTGLHALHMVIGLGIMLWLLWHAYRGRFDAEYFSPVEVSGLYWHFVDIVWIFLFPLLYLIGAHLAHT